MLAVTKTSVNKRLRKALSVPARRYLSILRPVCSLKGLTLSVAAAAIILCAFPERGFTRLPPIDSRDPYLRTMLLAKLTYGYESASNSTDGSTKTRDSMFFQTYDMNLTGNWWDPRFIIFDTNVTYTNGINTYSSGGKKLISHNWSYQFMTIILRKFRFPLTLLATRSTSESSSIGSVKTVRDTYRADWYLKFMVFPVTRLRARRIVSTVADDQSTSDTYGIEMTKELGRTQNRLYYDYSESGNSVQQITGFTNSTEISSNTRFTGSGVYHRGSSSNDNDTTTTSVPNSDSNSESMGLSMSLSSTPSRFFSQKHNYNYYSADTGDDDRTEGQIFNGEISFRPNASYEAGMSMSLDEVENDTLSNHMESEILYLDGTFKYRITQNLSFHQSVRYSRSESLEVETVTRETFYESISASSGISFSKDLSWATFSSSYGLGLVRTLVKPGGESTGITQDLSLSLSGIGKKIITVNGAFTASRNDNLTGEIWSSAETYSTTATNALWKKYVSMSADARHFRSRGYLDLRDNTSTSYSFNLSSNYLYNTSISSGYGYSESDTGIEGNNTQETYTLGVSRGQRVFRGLLTLSGAYMLHQSTTNKGVPEDRLNYNLLARYTRPLMWKINWIATGSFQHIETTTNEITSTRESLGLSNSLNYSLRAWNISMRHRYRKIESSTNLNYSESELLLKATRVIRRIF